MEFSHSKAHLHAERRTPVLGKDGQTNVAVAVDVRVDGHVVVAILDGVVHDECHLE